MCFLYILQCLLGARSHSKSNINTMTVIESICSHATSTGIPESFYSLNQRVNKCSEIFNFLHALVALYVIKEIVKTF